MDEARGRKPDISGPSNPIQLTAEGNNTKGIVEGWGQIQNPGDGSEMKTGNCPQLQRGRIPVDCKTGCLVE